MGKNIEVILSGVGGQGIVVGGTLLGKAAVEYAGKNAVSTSEYGVETRGTFTKSSVIISDSDIFYTDAIDPDIVIALADVAYKKYANELNEKTIMIYDNTYIKEEKNIKCEQIGFPITKIAKDIGSEAAANIVALGIILNKTKVIKKEFMEKALKEKFKNNQKILELNIDALNKGFDIASRRICNE